MKQSKAKVIGLTGGVGAGKSEVLSYLAMKEYCKVYELDKVAHRLQEPGQSCYRMILECFGEQILDERKYIDRMKLGEIVFGDVKLLEQLNQIIHPQVMEYIKVDIKKLASSTHVIVIEGAILIEAGYKECCHELWYVSASLDMRAKRVMESRGYTQEKFDTIQKNQLKENVFIKECDVILDNSKDKGTLYTKIENQLKILLGE